MKALYVDLLIVLDIYYNLKMCCYFLFKVIKYAGLAHAVFWPFHPQDLIRNSPYCLLYNSYDVNMENLVLDQLMIP